MRRPAFVLAVAVALVAGCRANSNALPAGQYSGSTQAQQAVNVVVGDKVLLDGVEMRATPNRWFVGAHDKKLRMRCHTAARNTEIVCTIDRHGLVETDELLKL